MPPMPLGPPTAIKFPLPPRISLSTKWTLTLPAVTLRNTSNYTQTNPTPGAYNCAPDLDLNDSDTGSNNFTTTFTEAGGAVNITDTDVKVTDSDDTNIEPATIILTNRPDGMAESLSLSCGLPTGISETDSYDNADGKMVLYFGWIY